MPSRERKVTPIPQVTAEQAKIAQAFTAWFNNRGERDRADALAVSSREAVARWVDATGASVADFDTAAALLDEGVITAEGRWFLRTRAWS